MLASAVSQAIVANEKMAAEKMTVMKSEADGKVLVVLVAMFAGSEHVEEKEEEEELADEGVKLEQ